MKSVLTCGLGIFLLFCNNDCAYSQDTHNSKNALDWAGIYRGILPCADCEGIQETVYLNKDLSFQVKSIYLGKTVNPRLDKGKFSWNAAGNIIALKDSLGHAYGNYFVKENSLVQLDGKNQFISGPLASMYILSKGSYAIVEKYWKLVELNGRQVRTDSGFKKEPHIIFKETGDRFSGNGGCNNISGQYTLINPDSVQFSKTISTRMACPGMQLESEFLKVLEATRTYSVIADRLALIDDSKKIIAVFKTVNMH